MHVLRILSLDLQVKQTCTLHVQTIIHNRVTRCAAIVRQTPRLNHKSFHSVLQLSNLWHQIAALVCRDASCDNSSAHTTCSAECSLARDIDVGNILVFGEKGQMQEDGKRRGVGCEDDNLGCTSVEGLGS